jgi:DNA-binding transcriptional MerR regulator
VDKHSGYLYYRSGQVRTATTIALLRSLDVPLPVVREVLAAPDEETVSAVLAVQRGRLTAELARREQVLRSLDALLLAPERVHYDVAIAEREPLRLVGVTGPVRAVRGRRPCTWGRTKSCHLPTRRALLEHVHEHGHQAQGPVTETYLTDPSTAAPEELVTRVAMALEP